MKSFFLDSDNKPSMGRLLSFVASCTGIMLFCFISVWSVIKGMPVDSGIVTGCTWLVGLGIGGKAASKIGEKK